MFKLLFPHAFPNEPPIRIVTGDFTKQASFCPPEIATFCSDLQPVDGKTYIHLNALGSSQIWGPNVNGDAFPEKGLMNKGASHGYKTFEHYAYVYQHHVNKDPAKAMGRVKIAAWNPMMHRVELIVEIDNDKGSGLIEKVAAGEYPDWSMGCKVPYDICSDCGHQAKKVAEYCDHLKYGMNKIADNGRRTCAINDFPKFFDISEVVIGADKVAKTLRKVAGQKTPYPSALLGLHYYGEDDGRETARIPATVKTAMPEGQGLPTEMLKIGRRLHETEPRFSASVLAKLASHPVPETLSTLAYTGIVLHPVEFQRIVLGSTGQAKIAAMLDAKGVVFPRVSDEEVSLIDTRPDGTVDGEHVSEQVFKIAEPYLPHRSILEPYVEDRIKQAERMPQRTDPSVDAEWFKTAQPGLIELLGALGLSYFLYRRSLPIEAKAFEQVILKKPWVAPILLGGAVGVVGMANAMMGPSPQAKAVSRLREAQTRAHMKLGAIPWKTIGTVIGPVALAYLAAASATRKRLQGYPLSSTEELVQHYPGPIGVLGAYGLTKARKALAGVSPAKMLAKLR